MAYRDLNEAVEHWRVSPYDFVVECLGVAPTEQQRGVLEAMASPGARVSIRSGHGTGKSTLFSWIALWALCCFWDVKIPATAPTAHQLSDILWPEIEKWRAQMLEPWRSAIRIKNDKITLEGTPGFVAARTGRKENPEALQGFHAEHMIFLIDEASGIPEVVFEVARGALSTDGARILMAANPTRLTGYFYNSHHKNRDLWTRFQFSCLDSPRVSPAYAQEIAGEYGEDSDMYRVRVLGEFPHASDVQFMPGDVVEAAMGKHLRADMYSFAPKVLGVDVALFGGDRSVIFLRQGLCSRLLFTVRGIRPEELADKVASLWDEHKADGVIVDATGVGEAVMSSLRLQNRTPIPFYAGNASLLDNCFNRRAEVWYKMRKWLADGGALPPENDLRDDLVGPEYSINGKGKIQLERKVDMKKRGLASPDLADALALTFGAEVLKAQTGYARYTSTGSSKSSEYQNYDPLGLGG
ncbi:MAG: hypothetical protein RRY12_10815 [Cloacibacillus sp.]